MGMSGHEVPPSLLQNRVGIRASKQQRRQGEGRKSVVEVGRSEERGKVSARSEPGIAEGEGRTQSGGSY